MASTDPPIEAPPAGDTHIPRWPPPPDPTLLARSMPPESGTLAGGCMLSILWLVGGAVLLGIMPFTLHHHPEAVIICLLGLLVGAGYMVVLPTAARRSWVRKRRLRGLIRRRGLVGGEVDSERLWLPLHSFGRPGSSAPDAADAAPMHDAINEAQNLWGLDFDGERFSLHLTALPAGRRDLARVLDTLEGPIRWLAGADDPLAAWDIARVLGHAPRGRMLELALLRLIARRPDAPVTARVVERALANPAPPLRLDAALAVRHGPTLEALCAPEIVEALHTSSVVALTRARIALGATLADLTHHALRLVWLVEQPALDAAELIELAGEPMRITRAAVWIESQTLTPAARLDIARRLVDHAEHDAHHGVDAHVIELGRYPRIARADPTADALELLGAHGTLDDVRRVARLLHHRRYGPPARGARASMRRRLDTAEASGQLSVPQTTRGGELSVDPGLDGRLSTPDEGD